MSDERGFFTGQRLLALAVLAWGMFQVISNLSSSGSAYSSGRVAGGAFLAIIGIVFLIKK